MIAQKQHASPHCLTEAEVRGFLAGRLDNNQFDTALSHLESCEICRSRVEALSDPSGDAPKSSFSWLRPDGGAEPFHGELECAAAVNDLLSKDAGSRLQLANAARSGEASLLLTNLGGYRIVHGLGSGGMGTVFLAEHERLKKKVAIKILTGDKARRSGWLERFNREMTSVAALEHENVVRALDAGEQEGVHYLVMEYLDGFDLSRVARGTRELSVASACEVIRQAALGLHAIHLAGMVHRDIKPSNLFLTQRGTVKLLDLGLVLDGESPVAGDDRLTTVGYLMGTLPYMSREQINDSSRVDFRADLYSLGATLFRLISGRAPMGSSTDLPGTVRRVTQEDCPSLCSFRADLPEELVELVRQLLDHDPHKRPASALAVAERLALFTEGADLDSLLKMTRRHSRGNASSHRTAMPTSWTGPPVASQLAEGSAGSGIGGFRGSWQRFLFFAALPVLLLCGVLLTLATDRGTLVIETKLDDVNVEVKRNDQVVESLRVSSASPKRIRLWSGNYTIELTGENLGRLEINRGEVAIFRGEQVAVAIRERTSSTAESESESDSVLADKGAGDTKIYQGKSFEHWLAVLSREQDLETLFEANPAVLLLADTPAKQEQAAREMLRPARHLGGVAWGQASQADATSQLERSQCYMGSLKEWFSRFGAETRIKAILAELRDADLRTAMACVLLLNDVNLKDLARIRDLKETLPTASEIVSELGRLQSWFETDSTRVGPKWFAKDLKTAALLALEVKIKFTIGTSGGFDRLSWDPQIVRWAEATYESARQEMESWVGAHLATEETGVPIVGLQESLTHMSNFNAVVIANALDSLRSLDDPRPLLLGMHTHFERFVTQVGDEDLKDAFWPFLSHKDGQPLAEATEYYLRSMASHPKQFGGGPELNPTIGKLAVKNLENHPKPHVALLTLARLKASLQRPDRSGIIKQPIEWPHEEAWTYAESVRQNLAKRLILEQEEDDIHRFSKIDYAVRVLNQANSVDQACLIEVMRLLNGAQLSDQVGTTVMGTELPWVLTDATSALRMTPDLAQFLTRNPGATGKALQQMGDELGERGKAMLAFAYSSRPPTEERWVESADSVDGENHLRTLLDIFLSPAFEEEDASPGLFSPLGGSGLVSLDEIAPINPIPKSLRVFDVPESKVMWKTLLVAHNSQSWLTEISSVARMQAACQVAPHLGKHTPYPIPFLIEKWQADVSRLKAIYTAPDTDAETFRWLALLQIENAFNLKAGDQD